MSAPSGPTVASTPGAPAASAQQTGGDIAAQLQAEYVNVVRTVGPSVVIIETDQGLGSGVVFDGKGDIVTNFHVVAGATSFKVTAADGKQANATLVGQFAADDLAVIHVAGLTLQPATFGNSNALVVGDIVLAIGNPLGLQSSVTEGIVSAVGRTVSEPGGAALAGVIQTSAAINPGNSGGALVNLAGQVIGIPTLAATDPELGGSAPGIGFAIPSSTATDIATQLVGSGKVTNSHRAYLGIRSADTYGAAGVLVYSVVAGGPAAKAGITGNELILSVNGTPTPDTTTFQEVLATLQPGQKVKVDLERAQGSTFSVEVTLGELPG